MILALVLSLLLNISLSLALLGLVYWIRGNKRSEERRFTSLLETNASLNDRLMYVTGHTWTPPPRTEPKEVVESELEEFKRYQEGWREV